MSLRATRSERAFDTPAFRRSLTTASRRFELRAFIVTRVTQPSYGVSLSSVKCPPTDTQTVLEQAELLSEGWAVA